MEPAYGVGECPVCRDELDQIITLEEMAPEAELATKADLVDIADELQVLEIQGWMGDVIKRIVAKRH
jgi:hypothetical protein